MTLDLVPGHDNDENLLKLKVFHLSSVDLCEDKVVSTLFRKTEKLEAYIMDEDEAAVNSIREDWDDDLEIGKVGDETAMHSGKL